MIKRFSARSAFCGMFLLFSLFSAPSAWGQAANTLIGAVFGLTYLQSYDTKEIDFYYGQTFYNTEPDNFGYFDTYSSTFGTDITLYHHDFFNWFMGTERLGRTGNGSISGLTPSQANLQWNIPVVGLYSGVRFDCLKVPLEPYIFAIGGVYSLADLLGGDAVLINGTYAKPTTTYTYSGATYNVTGTTLGLELGVGITPLTFWNDSLELAVEGNYRFVNFPNVYFSPTSSSLPPIPNGFPPSIDYSGWSIQLALSFEPSKGQLKTSEADQGKEASVSAREKLLAGNIPYNKDSFINAAENCDTYIVNLFLASGFKLSDEDLGTIANDQKICDEVKAMVKPQRDKQEKPGSNKTL